MSCTPAALLLAALLAAPPGPPPAPKYPTGARPSPPQVLAAAPKFQKDGRIGAPARFARVPDRLSMWGNSRYGDCVTAEEAFAKVAAYPHVWVSEDEAVRWARGHGVLNGATLSEVLDMMREDGLLAADGKTYRDGQKLLVDYADRATLAEAIYKGPVKIAVASGQIMDALNRSGGKSGWYATDWRRDNKTDHCVSLSGYGPAEFLYAELKVPLPAAVKPDEYGYLLFSWNSIGFVNEKSLLAVCREAWYREPTTAGFPEPQPKPDPKPPAAPSGLAATALSDSQVRLTWADNSDDEAGFLIESAPDPEFARGLAATRLPGPDRTAGVAVGLRPGVRYFFRVRAFNAAGESGPSNVVSATPADPAPDPTPDPKPPRLTLWCVAGLVAIAGLVVALAYAVGGRLKRQLP